MSGNSRRKYRAASSKSLLLALALFPCFRLLDEPVAERFFLPAFVLDFTVGTRGRGDDFVQHRHRDFAPGRDADFQSVAQDLAQGSLARICPPARRLRFAALRRLDNRHEQRHELLDAAAGDAGTFKRIANEIAAPFIAGRHDDQRIRPARLLCVASISSRSPGFTQQTSPPMPIQVLEENPRGGACRLGRAQFAEYGDRRLGIAQRESVERRPGKKGEIEIPRVLPAEHRSE